MNYVPALFAFYFTSELLVPSLSSRILAVFPYNGRSHNIMFEAITNGLAREGHQVDVISHFPVKNPSANYRTIINLAGTARIPSNMTVKLAEHINARPAYFTSKLGNLACDLLGLQSIQELMRHPPNDPPYDLLITEVFGFNCFIGMGYFLKIPVVGISTTIEYPWIVQYTGNGDNPATVPDVYNVDTKLTNFWSRLNNFLSFYKTVYLFNYYSEDFQTNAIRKYLDPEMPSIREVEKSIALILTNSNPVLTGVKPLLPTIVQVSGIHIEENNEKLSPELQKWMDESVNGVVYFTMGSMIKIETLPKEILLAMYASFEKIKPVKVLMKILTPGELPPNLPNNVRILEWVPQIPVLAHKNTRAFITHGGLMGCTEALYFGVPLIGIPIFNDQFRNLQMFQDKNISVVLDVAEITEEKMTWALKAILDDPIYKKSAMHYSQLYRDRPMSAMKTAIYWVEYIIRNGPHVLRTSALDYNWWQIALLDIYGFLLLSAFSICALVYFLLKLIVRKSIVYIKRKSKSDKKIN